MAALLLVMALLMFGAARQESATVDEANEIASGYLSWKGSMTRIGAEEHPPLSQLLSAFPLLFMDVKLSDTVRAITRGELGYPWTLNWSGKVVPVQTLPGLSCNGRYMRVPPLGDPMVQWSCASPYPLENWYYWAVPEGQMFGKFFLYEGVNNADAILLAGRMMQIALTLLTGVVVFFWTRRTSGRNDAASFALALWVFNPVVLAYGHLTKNDIGVTLGITLAIYCFTEFLRKPGLEKASLAGFATGVAMTMKFTALVLLPVFVILLVLARNDLKLSFAEFAKLTGIFALAGWAVAMVVFLPHWSPAPPLSDTEATAFEIPAWFRMWRPVLIPAGLFKGIAIATAHAKGGTDSYLIGQWRQGGWWYYFPVAFLVKLPVAYVILTAGGLAIFVRAWKSAPLLERAPWIAAGMYLLVSMSSGVNIGVRHLLPMLALCTVGTGCAFGRLTNSRAKIGATGLLAWLTLTALLAYPLYIQFFSEAVGGARNGQKYLIDSNFDWGQDAKRLKKYLDEHHITHIYLDYFGNQFSIEYLKIPNTRVNAENARQIPQGILVVSASQLMRPEWSWLRESRQPIARVAHTLFVYQFP